MAGRGYDTTGATVGAAGHDAATLVAAEIATGVTSKGEAFTRWAELRDQILNDSLQAQGVAAIASGTGASPASAPAGNSEAAEGGAFVMPFGKHKGKSIATIHGLPADESGRDGASYLTWLLENSDKADIKAHVRAFLGS